MNQLMIAWILFPINRGKKKEFELLLGHLPTSEKESREITTIRQYVSSSVK